MDFSSPIKRCVALYLIGEGIDVLLALHIRPCRHFHRGCVPRLEQGLRQRRYCWASFMSKAAAARFEEEDEPPHRRRAIKANWCWKRRLNFCRAKFERGRVGVRWNSTGRPFRSAQRQAARFGHELPPLDQAIVSHQQKTAIMPCAHGLGHVMLGMARANGGRSSTTRRRALYGSAASWRSVQSTHYFADLYLMVRCSASTATISARFSRAI